MNWITAGMRLLTRLYPGDSVIREAQLRMAAYSEVPAESWRTYSLLRAYYQNNGLYSQVSEALRQADVPLPDNLPLRNPAFRVVEFYAACLWGPLETQTERQEVADAIALLWQWSNWDNRKAVFARWLPMLGDCFVKVAKNEAKTRVVYQLIDPANIPEFKTDERGYIVWCRIDTVLERGTPETGASRRTQTEIWSKEAGTVRVWIHTRPGIKTEELERIAFDTETPLGDSGIDFVPIVHCMFRDVGEERGVGAYALQLDKIDETNRKVTRLSSLLFTRNDLTWVIEGQARDRDNAPLEALSIDNQGAARNVKKAIVGGTSMWSLPPGFTIRDVVPQIDYRASLDAVLADMAELQQDLPEMAYWKITEAGSSNLSGRALRTLLIPAVARAKEAASNAHHALQRLNEMGMTIGREAGLPGFEGVGSYEKGDFEHSYEPPDVIPLSSMEQAEEEEVVWRTIAAQVAMGMPLEILLRKRGYSQDEIDEITRLKEQEEAKRAERAATLFSRGQQLEPEPPADEDEDDEEEAAV